MSDTVYLVLRTAIYLQGVFGVMQDVNAAIDLCKELARNDVDSHHEWWVVSCPVDTDLRYLVPPGAGIDGWEVKAFGGDNPTHYMTTEYRTWKALEESK